MPPHHWHNGFINVFSEAGKGTTFRIYLPRHAGEIDDSEDQNSEDMLRGHGKVVLVAEDDKTILRMIGKMLENLGCIVLAAKSPADAVRIAHERTEKINPLLSDIIMPGMNGRDLADRIVAIHPQIMSQADDESYRPHLAVFMEGVRRGGKRVIATRTMTPSNFRTLPSVTDCIISP